MTPTLETLRLVLRPIELGDAEQVQPLFGQWEVVRYLHHRVPWPYPPDGALTYYRDVALPAVERGEQWHWTLRLKSDPVHVIGAIGLMRGEGDNRGFWLGLPWQGRGLMAEACGPVTDFWFNVVGAARLRVPKARDNVASRRISERCGMRAVSSGERDYVGGRLQSDLWEISAEEWAAFRAREV